MATNVVKTLKEDFLHCSICMNRFKVPKVLPCIHSFCQDCLERYVHTRLKSNKLPCPTCRQVCDLTETGVKGLQTNFHLVNLGERMDLLDRLDSSEANSYTCDSCESMDVSVYCFECDFKICAKCQSQHKRFPTLRSHTVVPIKEIKHPKYQQALQNAKAPNCDIHPTESLRFYCKTCLKLICRDCTIVQHPKPDHECLEASHQLNDVKLGLSKLLNESASHLVRNLEFIKKGQVGSETVARESKAVRQEIKNVYEKMTTAIEKQLKSQMENMFINVTEAETQQRMTISEKVEKASTWVTRLKNTQEVTKKLINENNLWEILGMSSGIISAFQVLKCDSKEFVWHQSELKQNMLFYPQNVPPVNLGRCRSECDVVLHDSNGNFITCTFDRRTSTVYLSRLRKDKYYNWDEADHITPYKWETVSPANAKLTAAVDSSQQFVFVGLGRSIAVFNLSTQSFGNVMKAKMAEGMKDFTQVSWLGVGSIGNTYIYVKQSHDQCIQKFYCQMQYADSYEMEPMEVREIVPECRPTSQTLKEKLCVLLANAGKTEWAIPDEYSNVDCIIVYSNCLLCTLKKKSYDEETTVLLLKKNECTLIKSPQPESLVTAKILSIFKAPLKQNTPQFGFGKLAGQQITPYAVVFDCYFLWCGKRRDALTSSTRSDKWTLAITEYDSRNKSTIRSWIVPEESALPVACYRDTSTNELKICDKYGTVTTCLKE